MMKLKTKLGLNFLANQQSNTSNSDEEGQANNNLLASEFLPLNRINPVGTDHARTHGQYVEER